MVHTEKWYIQRNKANNIMNIAHKIMHESNEQMKETFKCYSVLFSSLLGDAETVVTIYKQNTDIIINTHTVPTVIDGGPSLSLKRYNYKTAGGCSLTSYPGPHFNQHTKT